MREITLAEVEEIYGGRGRGGFANYFAGGMSGLAIKEGVGALTAGFIEGLGYGSVAGPAGTLIGGAAGIIVAWGMSQSWCDEHPDTTLFIT